MCGVLLNYKKNNRIVVDTENQEHHDISKINNNYNFITRSNFKIENIK